MPNTVFDNYSFNATGGSTPRTMPDRINDIVNVKDFGAVGDGNNDDWQAIINAIKQAANSGKIGGNLKQGGMVYFPPGEYHITKTITPQVANSFVSLVGAGRWNTAITGTMAGQYLLQQFFGDHTSITWANPGGVGTATVTTHFPHHFGTNGTTLTVWIVSSNVAGFIGVFTATVTGASTFTYPLAVNPGASSTSGQYESAGSIDYICNMAFENFSNDNSLNDVGAVRGAAQQSTTYLNVYFNGFFGLNAGIDGTFETSCYGCKFDGPASLTGSIGYQGPSRLYGCSIFSYDIGCAFTSFGSISIGTRIENCNTAFYLGYGTGIAYGAIIGGSTERVNTNVFVNNVAGFQIIGFGFTGTVGNGQANQDYGIRFSANPGTLIVDGCNVSITPINTAGIDCTGVTNAANITFRNTTAASSGPGVAWKMPTAAKQSFVFQNCNNPAFLLAFTDLPSSAIRVEGMEFNLNDAVIAGSSTFGSAITAGSSTGHAKVRWNASSSNWTLMGL